MISPTVSIGPINADSLNADQISAAAVDVMITAPEGVEEEYVDTEAEYVDTLSVAGIGDGDSGPAGPAGPLDNHDLGISVAGIVDPGPLDNDDLGISVAGIGDLDGDGRWSAYDRDPALVRMHDFPLMCDQVKKGELGAGRFAYRIVFVRRGHSITRWRRMLVDATITIVKPFSGAEHSIKLSTLLAAVRETCGNTGACTCECLRQYVAQQHHVCDFEPALHALVEKNYITIDDGQITVLD